MRARWWVAVVVAAAGCDFKAAPPPPPAAPPPPPPVAVVGAVGSGSGSGSDVTPDCIAVADHLVGLAIAAIPDATEQAAQQASRAKNVHVTAQACTKAGWSPALLRCYVGASTQAAAGACAP